MKRTLTILAVLSLSVPALAQEPEAGVAPPVESGGGGAGGRPELMSVGIGAGIVVPGDVTQPNTVSVRVKLLENITLEPIVTLGYGSDTQTTEFTGGSTEDGQSALDVQVSAVARLTLASRNKVDFSLLGAVMLGYSGDTDDPDGPDNSTDVSTIGLGLGWGLGLEWFVKSQWSFSFDAINPLFSLSSTTTNPPGDGEASDSSMFFGVVFDPTVRIMTHIYW